VNRVPFEYFEHLPTVPVTVAGRERRFVLDTGIGLTILSSALAASIGCDPDGSTYTGRRMSGQEVDVPLASLAELEFGGHVRRDLTVGIFDMGDIDGFFSIGFFDTVPLTFDYRDSAIVVEDAGSFERRLADGVATAVHPKRDGPTLDVFLDLTIPSGRSISVLVDTGSDSLILDQGLAPDVGVALDDPSVRAVEGEDETGHGYTRYFTKVSGAICVTGAPSVRQEDPETMFQKIIYDGLIGDSFLKNFAVTYDLQNERMVFS
jgi:hypothetical protein